MQSEFSKDLEDYIISRYASIRQKFGEALRDQNEYKNLPQISFGLLTLLNNVRNVKPHADYLIESLESADLKLRAINFLLKTQNECKGKDNVRLTMKSTLNGDEYFKEKIERMKAKAAPNGLRKTNILTPGGGAAESAQPQENSFARGKPMIRSYKEVEAESGGNQDFQFANKKNKLTTEESGYFKSTSSFEPTIDKKSFENTEASTASNSDMPSFTSAKDQFMKNQEQKKKFGNDGGNGYSNQNSYYNKNKGGYGNNSNGYGGYNKGKQPYYNQNRGKGFGNYGDEMEEEVGGGYGGYNRNYNNNKPYNNRYNNNYNNNHKDESEDSAPQNSGILEKVHFSAFRKNLNGADAQAGGSSTLKSEENNSGTTGGGLLKGGAGGGGLRKKFVPPLKENQNQGGNSSLGKQNSSDANDKLQDERYKGLDPKVIIKK